MKYVIIDDRIRKIEESKLEQLQYRTIHTLKNNNLYDEISSHVDIVTCKIENKIIVEPNLYNSLKSKISPEKIIKGQEYVKIPYPYDIKYNVCIVGKKAFHKFEFTDKRIVEELRNQGYEMINTNQGYTNCSVAVIDNNSAIVTDKGLYKIMQKHGIHTLYLDYEPDIKLLQEAPNVYSSKKGFIGGALSRIGTNIIVFGSLQKIDKNNQIRNFIKEKNLNLIDFDGLDVIDYGGLVEI